MSNEKVIRLYSCGVYEFPWGTAVKEFRTQRWIRPFLSRNYQEIDVEGIPVELHENGIEFL